MRLPSATAFLDEIEAAHDIGLAIVHDDPAAPPPAADGWHSLVHGMAALMQGPGMSNYNVAKAGVLALSESLLVELRQLEVSVHVVCPSFFQTNLLDSFRGPTPAMKAQVGKLLESSPISASDIADYIYQQVAAGEFMILPHEQGRMAWALIEAKAKAGDHEAADLLLFVDSGGAA